MSQSHQDAAEIARELTKAQRHIVLGHSGERFDAAEVFGIEPSLFSVWNAGGAFAWLTSPTSFGLAVRAILVSQAGDV